MNILMAASEAVPFCKTGGLADVVGALARILGRMGHRVVLFLPAYKVIETGSKSLKPVPGQFWIPIGDDLVAASLLHTSWEGVEVYFVRNPKYFSRKSLYREDDKDYSDNDERFIFFSRAVLEGAKLVGFKPDVIHCHDWQTALIPAYLRTLYRSDAYYARTANLLTIHNIAHQGVFAKDTLFLADFGWADFTPERLEYYGKFNFLKAGLVFADVLNTVSPNYAKEIQGLPEFGCGLEGVLRKRAADLHGVLNGIDVDVWNPEKDINTAARFGIKNFREGKRTNKAAFQKQTGLALRPDVPLIGIISRLDPQKGLDVAVEAIPKFLAKGAQIAILGTGDKEHIQAFADLAQQYPSSVFFRSVFNEAWSHQSYAASDLFLMPSRFEPCGLGQMLAMRYGSVPIVTHTGGLADTVRELPEARSPQNGFVAAACTLEEISAAMARALKAFAKPESWRKIVRDGMGSDFSWERSVSRYLELYRQAVSKIKE